MRSFITHASTALATLSLSSLAPTPLNGKLPELPTPNTSELSRAISSQNPIQRASALNDLVNYRNALQSFVARALPPTSFVAEATTGLGILQRAIDESRRAGHLVISENDATVLNRIKARHDLMRRDWEELQRLERSLSTTFQQSKSHPTPQWLSQEIARMFQGVFQIVSHWRQGREWRPLLADYTARHSTLAGLIALCTDTRAALELAHQFTPDSDRRFSRSFQRDLEAITKRVKTLKLPLEAGPRGSSLEEFLQESGRARPSLEQCSSTFLTLNTNEVALHQRYEEGTREEIVDVFKYGVSILGGFITVTLGAMLWQSIRESRERSDQFFSRGRREPPRLTPEQEAKIHRMWR
jgi:hypothetical protein